ncbi:hypothetical protein HYE67_003206 [Fusarium culmorum]|uniref:Uncharacterized protein n=1 Tax=Fusarium culmorum TaxID=5516 RepID=A0A7S8D393_FUSCU|nr:hypothetical protein HYE67_003206 [Fusarium culmorum]
MEPPNPPPKTEYSGEAGPIITAVSARYRAAWPQLRRRPLEISRASLPAAVEARQGEIELLATKILRDFHLFNDDEYDGVELVQMGSSSSTSVPTIAICASWSEDKQGLWVSAVQAIAMELYKMYKGYSFNYESIHIDIIREIVYQRLESFEATTDCMCSICLFNYGILKEINNNPPTISISVDDESSETGWLRVINDIKSNISRHGGQSWMDVNVHIEHIVEWNEFFD